MPFMCLLKMVQLNSVPSPFSTICQEILTENCIQEVVLVLPIFFFSRYSGYSFSFFSLYMKARAVSRDCATIFLSRSFSLWTPLGQQQCRVVCQRNNNAAKMVSGHRRSILFNLYYLVSDNFKWRLFYKIFLKCDVVFQYRVRVHTPF